MHISMHAPGRTGSRVSQHCLAVLGLVMLASCSGPADKVDRIATNDAGFQILPEMPLSGNELRLAYGLSPAAMGGTLSDTEDGDGSGFIWSVNGQNVGRGLSLTPGLFRRGDRVSVRLKEDDMSVERSFVIIGNSPPEIHGVSIRRDAARPDIAMADFSATDPDGDRLTHHFTWSVDGEIVKNCDGPEYRLDDQDRGQSVSVVLRSSDGELTTSRTSSPALLENHAPELSVAAQPRIIASDDGQWAELALSMSDPDADPCQVEVIGDYASFDAERSLLRWPLHEGNEEFSVVVRVTDDAGGTTERELRLKR